MPDAPALVVDIREAYRRSLAPLPAEAHVPLGVLLAEPERLPRDRPVLLVSDRAEQAAFAARYLRGLGVDARS
jgi:rhodanese-related sulfurtransferase